MKPRNSKPFVASQSAEKSQVRRAILDGSEITEEESRAAFRKIAAKHPEAIKAMRKEAGYE